MTRFESPELVALFTAYTGAPDSIGSRLTDAATRGSAGDPLIVVTATDIVLYPGHGAPPQVEGYRMATRGFKEITAVSHLGPAVASVVRLREIDGRDGWRDDAARLRHACQVAREANSAELWQRIGVASYAGREAAIAAMTDYACRVTERYLGRCLAEGGYASAATLRRDYLAGPSEDLPVPVNRTMIATFFLAGMDIAHRILAWFDGLELDWERAMVIVAGRAGRATAGVTVGSNSVAGIVLAASRGRLRPERVLVAPHARSMPPVAADDPGGVTGYEDEYRRLWAGVRATAGLGASMFAGLPAFEPLAPDSAADGRRPISGSDDWHGLTSRLRLVLEDPRQQLSSAVTDFACTQLLEHGNDPRAVVVPGLDGEPYPAILTST